jgi:hypothetical protein
MLVGYVLMASFLVAATVCQLAGAKDARNDALGALAMAFGCWLLVRACDAF